MPLALVPAVVIALLDDSPASHRGLQIVAPLVM